MGLDAVLDEIDLDVSSFFEGCKDVMYYNDVCYLIPQDTNVIMLYYNPEIAKECGLDPENPPKTIEELDSWSDAMTVKAADGSYNRLGIVPWLDSGNEAFILPYLFGEGLASTAFMWPHIPISFAGIDYSWNVLGYGVARNAAGEVVIGGGLGYFLSYEIRSFVAQCVNFPLQRNVTFKSHGNVAYQILWYFIAWVLISLFCNAINGLWLPLAQARFDPAVYLSLIHI